MRLADVDISFPPAQTSHACVFSEMFKNRFFFPGMLSACCVIPWILRRLAPSPTTAEPAHSKHSDTRNGAACSAATPGVQRQNRAHAHRVEPDTPRMCARRRHQMWRNHVWISIAPHRQPHPTRPYAITPTTTVIIQTAVFATSAGVKIWIRLRKCRPPLPPPFFLGITCGHPPYQSRINARAFPGQF